MEASVSEHVRAALGASYPLVILRAPHGFGKGTAIQEWVASCGFRATVAQVRLVPSVSVRAERFWASLLEGLERAGVRAPVGEDGAEGVRAAVLAHPGPLVLVVDDYHHSGDASRSPSQLAERLVALLQEAPHLRLIVACRWPCALEIAGSLAVDSVVVGVRELALGTDQVSRLARARGLEAEPAEIETLTDDLAGWPAAIRASLDASARSGGRVAVDTDFVSRAVTLIHREIESLALRDFVLRIAVPEEIDERIAATIAGGPQGRRMLRLLLEAGFLVSRRTDGGMRYGYARAIRRAVLELAEDTWPDVVREVHRLLIPAAVREERYMAALRHACLAREWESASEIIESGWTTLIIRHGAEFAALAQSFPGDIVTANPRLTVARADLARFPSGRKPELARWRAEDAGYLRTVTDLFERPGVDEVGLLMQWGVGSLLAADDAAAAYAFGRVHDIGARRGDPRARRLGLSGMMSAAAVVGEARTALQLAGEFETSRRSVQRPACEEADRIETAARNVVQIFAALAAVDVLAPDAATRVAELREPQRRDDIWAMAAYVRAQYAVVTGTQAELGRHVSVLRAAMRHLVPGGITESTIVTGLAELLVQMGSFKVAADVLDDVPFSHVVAPIRAFVHLASGERREAIDLARRALETPLVTIRGRLVAQLTLACAYRMLGRAERSAEAFAASVVLSRESGLRRFFALLPRDVVTDMAEDPQLAADLQPLEAAAGSPLRRLRGLETPDGVSVRLSGRELEVLTALHRHPGPTGIGEELGLSANTVKTHLRRIYRKLGVGGRADALRMHHAHTVHESLGR